MAFEYRIKKGDQPTNQMTGADLPPGPRNVQAAHEGFFLWTALQQALTMFFQPPVPGFQAYRQHFEASHQETLKSSYLESSAILGNVQTFEFMLQSNHQERIMFLCHFHVLGGQLAAQCSPSSENWYRHF